jgi:DNA-binding transcriptional LysR family regulator
MNLQQLRYVVAVADHGTMTTAAQCLHVSQPALSRAIRELEQELQTVLFERIGRNVTLAANAEPVVIAARRVLAAVDDVVRAAESASTPPLVLCTTASVAALFADRVMPILADQLIDRHIRILHADGPDEIERLVITNQAELGAIDRLPHSDLSATTFGEEEVVLLSPPNTELPDPVPFAALDGLRLVMPAIGTARRREADEFFTAAGITPIVALETEDRSTWTSAVLANIGSVLWYATNARDAKRSGARIRSFAPPIYRRLYLVHRPQQLSPAASTILELVGELEAAAQKPRRTATRS